MRDVVHEKRATHAALFVLILKHEVIQDKLVAVLEKIQESLLVAVKIDEVKFIHILDFDHGELAASAGEIREFSGNGFLLF